MLQFEIVELASGDWAIGDWQKKRIGSIFRKDMKATMPGADANTIRSRLPNHCKFDTLCCVLAEALPHFRATGRQI